MTSLPVPADAGVPSPGFDLEAVAARAAGLAEGARAANTRKAYASDWRHFTGWCNEHGLIALPAVPATVGLYLAAHETALSMATLTRRLSAIAVAHRMVNHPMDTRHPAIRDVLRGLRRPKGVVQGHAEALTVPLLRRLLATCSDRVIDRARVEAASVTQVSARVFAGRPTGVADPGAAGRPAPSARRAANWRTVTLSVGCLAWTVQGQRIECRRPRLAATPFPLSMRIQTLAFGHVLPWFLALLIMFSSLPSWAEGRAWLGINYDKQTFVVPPNPYRPGEFSYRGAAVRSVTPGSPGEQAGLQPNDVIVSFNGTEIREASDLSALVARLTPGAMVDVVVVRWRKEVLLTVTLGTNPGAPGAQTQVPARDTDLSLCDVLADKPMRDKCRSDLGRVPVSSAPSTTAAPSRADGLRCMEMKTLLEGYNCQVALKNRCQALETRGEAAACRALTKTDGIADDAEAAPPEAVERGKRLAAEAEQKLEPPALPSAPKGSPVRGCDAFVADYEAARKRMEMVDRFPMPAFQLYPTKTKDGRQIAVSHDIPNTEFYLVCTSGGKLAAVDIAGLSSEEADTNRLSAVMSVAASVAAPSMERIAVNTMLIDLEMKVQAAMAADANRDSATETQLVNGYSVRLTMYRSRARRLQIAADTDEFLADISNVTDTEEQGVLAEASDPDLQNWRCDARDPDGRIGVIDVRNDHKNRLGPFLRPGECIIRAQPVDLVRSPQRLLNRTIEMSRMGCYRHDIDDYRCIPFGPNTINRSGNQLVVMAGALSDPKAQAHIDQYCSTMRRGMIDSNCRFEIQFEVSDIGSDHTETIRIIRSREVTVK